MRGAQPYVASKWQRRDLNLARYFLREGSPTPSEGLLHVSDRGWGCENQHMEELTRRDRLLQIGRAGRGRAL